MTARKDNSHFNLNETFFFPLFDFNNKLNKSEMKTNNTKQTFSSELNHSYLSE